MPPKKQQQENLHPYVPFYVLPIFLKDDQESQPQKILKTKPINIKKCIDQTKIIEILKDKGLAQYMNAESGVTQEGRRFICENIKTVLQDFISEINKPIDPKKDAGKKDSKKEGKKQQIPADGNKQPTIELTFEKKCNDFYILLDIPRTVQELSQCIESGLKIDAVIIVDQRIKKGSNLPNYDLLGKSYEPFELIQTLNQTKIDQNKKQFKTPEEIERQRGKKRMIREIKRLKNQNPAFSSLLLLSIPFERDISHPENNELDFINSFFGKLCEISRQKQNYDNWVKSSVKVTLMIEPSKQIVKKQVPVQSQDKKGKKDANKQPQFTIVEQVIETRYQSLPENIRSDLRCYRQLLSSKGNQNDDSIDFILQNCLKGIQLEKEKGDQSLIIQINPEKALEKFNSKPFLKTTYIDSLKRNLRPVQHFVKNDMTHNLIHATKQIEQNVTLAQIQHEDITKKESLEFEFIIKKFTEFMNEQQPRIRIDFSDRVYKEKLNKNQVLSTIQHELLKDPKVYEGALKKDHLKLLCLARINPPGRVLYHNNIFQSRAVPNFGNWFRNFRQRSNGGQNFEFLDYKFEDTGNLSIKKQIATPTDNVTICDERMTIGSKESKLIHFSKLNAVYGIRHINNSGNNQFWMSNQKDHLNISIFQKEHHFKKTSKITEQVQGEGTEKIQSQIESFQVRKRIELWMRTDHFIISQTPYPTIIWLNEGKKNHSTEIRRQFGPKGEVTSYLQDGTIRILYANGNTSTFRNNKWERIVQNQLILSDTQKRDLQFREETQTDKVIRIRQDQTVFVQLSNGNSMVLFNDGTKVLWKRKQNQYEIRNYHPKLKEDIVVRIAMPRSKDFNIIGHGSAFAYLGFKNILQRSYDGFLYEVWHNKFSTHLYNEKFEFENKIYDEQIRLIHLSDGSLIKMEGQQHITLIQGDYENTEEKLRQKWNQAFNLQQNHEQGVYDINLEQGFIKTKDAESNCFKINVEQENEINIAVSFKINEQNQEANNFGNGFHVPEENYFLPAPQNCLPPRIFSFNNKTNQYYEYLNEELIRQMTLATSLYREEETALDNRTIKQFTRQKKQKDYFDDSRKIVTFSQPPSLNDFLLPSTLIAKQTRINLDVENNEVQFRLIEKVDWDKQFANINSIEEKIRNKKENREKELKSFMISV